MFSGIVTFQSHIGRAAGSGGIRALTVTLPRGLRVRAGESININGICSTVAKTERGAFTVQYMPETLRKTTAGGWKKGMRVNLEQPLRPSSFVSGHFVTGHVDGVGTVVAIKKEGLSKTFFIEVPRPLFPLIAPKGSVTVDGVGLTVVEKRSPPRRAARAAEPPMFSVSLIPYTLAHTTLGEARAGEKVNIECDIVAKYIAELVAVRPTRASRGVRGTR